MAEQSPGLAAEIEAMRKVDRVFSDAALPEATRRRVYLRMTEEYGPQLFPRRAAAGDGPAADDPGAAGAGAAAGQPAGRK